ncbi:MAG: hypothetical protein A2X53_20145 [Candidatus Rokubacteria bacterium GWA2_70_23]|nr:MAG: hypothetical protein A2X53_20145 [Candidatus Rokubacteria bacterium GWA2_70_23]
MACFLVCSARKLAPEIEDLYARQARETDRKKREALIHQIQQIMHDRCAIGSWGGRRPSLAPSVKLSGPEGARGWAAYLRMALMLTTLAGLGAAAGRRSGRHRGEAHPARLELGGSHAPSVRH